MRDKRSARTGDALSWRTRVPRERPLRQCQLPDWASPRCLGTKPPSRSLSFFPSSSSPSCPSVALYSPVPPAKLTLQFYTRQKRLLRSNTRHDPRTCPPVAELQECAAHLPLAAPVLNFAATRCNLGLHRAWSNGYVLYMYTTWFVASNEYRLSHGPKSTRQHSCLRYPRRL
jgi:hypothetical protein